MKDLDTEDCPFCRIVRGQDSSVLVVCEERTWLAFFPPEPATPGHTLVVPREHVTDFWALPEELARTLGAASLRVGRAVQAALQPGGMNLITSAGEVAEQTVPHVHLHVLPRWAEDRVGPIWPSKQETDSALMSNLAGRVAAACTG
jgi:diadenosine tetraphosphate (Ap4A) HIT family hydrolase